MGNWKYKYDKSSKKYHCPQCTKKRFVRYIDTETGDYLPEKFGRCDRESKCGYDLNPYKDGYNKDTWKQENELLTFTKVSQNVKFLENHRTKNLRIPKIKKRAFIPDEVLCRTRLGYDKNVFIQNLLQRVKFPFDVQDIEKVISLYHLGTVQNGYRTGAVTFPFIDTNGNVRTIQVKQFDEANHTTGTDFLHSMIDKHYNKNNKSLPVWLEAYKKNETKVSCLFGEHLLNKYPHNPIALVEAPKTAVYGSLYFGFPDEPTNLLWLAVYNLSSLNLNKCKALKGRNVFLFPDLSKDSKAYKLWSKKAKEIQKRLQGSYFHVSDLLEQLAPQQDKEQGKDIADYLIRQDWRHFRKEIILGNTRIEKNPEKPRIKINAESEKSEKCEALKKTFFSHVDKIANDEVLNIAPFIQEQADDWSNDIAELERYFSDATLVNQTISLNSCSTITDSLLFIENHLTTVKANNGKKIFLPYLNRLKEFKTLLTTNSN